MNMMADVEPAVTFYPARLAVLDAAYKRYFSRTDALQKAMIAGFVLAGVLLYLLLRGVVTGTPLLVVLAATVAVIPLYLHMMRLRDRTLRLFVHYELAVGRIDGTKTQSGNTGEEFRVEGHLYERDLNVLGADSLFGMLDTVRTGVGQRGLAKLLLYRDAGKARGAGGARDAGDIRDAILARRAAIEELTGRNDLRERIAMLGPSRFQQVPAAFFDKWLDEPAPVFHRAGRVGMVATTTVVALLTILGLAHVLPWDVARPNIVCALAIQATIALTLRKRVLPLLESSKSISAQMQLFRDGLELVQGENFTSQRLRELKQVMATPGDAVRLLKKIQQQFVIVEQRTKEWFLIPSLLLCAGTHAAISIAMWKRRNAAAMMLWLTAWAEFEALSALATYAYEHPENTYPEILDEGTAVFEATTLAHPLLPANAVANDVALNAETRVYLISGSNMAGKSTLLRSVGANAVLAATGAPIRATRARMSPLVIGASIALSDSLAEGRSKFLAEVERLHAILEAARSAGEVRVLFLIDEIFSGTNSLDRKVAAEAVTRALVGHGAVGALSTHDLTLTEMGEFAELRAVNVHMASADASDPLAFDYRLKPGVNQSSNALAIVRMMGIGV
ncbi:MAG: hypothetical protein PW789_04485 [Edaphobacter sp.]|uniref:MutS-related protein n=1 Tax=Edaphobacter sp. TaxID=1934404 RepID=UPI0023A09348|nr:hypothetical protein [Edaphobacter sp.]MDE1175845.1 hypothetical protein [Edaphobacter sp.]